MKPCLGLESHKYVFLQTRKWSNYDGNRNTHYIRVDEFFCEKCLEYEEKRFDEYKREVAPDWFRGK